MFKDKFLIFIILVIALLSIGVASAEESSTNSTDDSGIEVVTSVYDENTSLDVVSRDNIETSDEDVKSFSNENTSLDVVSRDNIETSLDDVKSSNCDNNNLFSSNPKYVESNDFILTFTELKNAINSSKTSLSLNSDIKMTDSEKNNFVDGISISKNIAIDGKGFTIDARNLGRIFNIASGYTFTLSNVILINGKHGTGGNDGAGGAICNQGTLSLTNVTFISNYAKSGAVIANYGHLTVTGCSFVNNSGGKLGLGGTIFNENAGSLFVSGSSFVNNSAWWGGAIYIQGSFNNWVVSGCTFVNNSVSDSQCGGGAIYSYASGSVSGCSFVDNSADYRGSAIYGYYISANNNWWGSNTPNWGGLISGNEVSHDTYAVLNLTATDKNVAINFYKSGTNEVINVPVRDVSLTIGNTNILGKIVNGTFKTNYVAPDGNYKITAIVDNQKLVANFLNCVYVDSENGDDYSNDGSSWDSPVKTILMATHLVPSNGKIYLADGTYRVSDQIKISKPMSIVGNGIKTVITNNKNGKGVFTITVNDVSIYNCNFVNNSGGAIYNSASSNVVVSGCTFVNNTATSGGAIYNAGSGFTVTNSVFINNTATNQGDAIYSVGSCSANDNWWGNNTPDWNKLVYGNVAHNTYAVLKLTVTADAVNVNFYKSGTNEVIKIPTRNLTLTIDNQEDTYEIVDGTFIKPYVNEGNYVITASVDNEKVTINVIRYVYVDYVNGKNDGTYDGFSWDKPLKTIAKAMSMVSPNARIYLADGNHIVDNQIFVDKTVTIVGNGTNTVITTNKKDRVFYVIASDVAIYKCTFANNSGLNGGVIYNTGSSLTVSGCNFVNNSVSYYGGVIYNTGSSLTVSGCNFVNNSAWWGGVISNENEGSISVSGCRFVNNSAYSGGAISNRGFELTSVSGCSFVNNYVTNDGGAIFNHGSVSVSDCNFVNNSAKSYGAAICGYSSVSVSDCTFSEGTANRGIIYNGGTLTLNNNKYSGIDGGKTYIYNDGTLSSVVVTVLDNETITVKEGSTISLYAVITCDGASVTGRDLKFLINGNSYNARSNINGSYITSYNLDLANPEEVVSASYDGAGNVVVNTAVLTYKLVCELNVSIGNITYGEDLIISGNITKGVSGNVTITINDTRKYNATISDDGKIYYIVPDLFAGDYKVTVSYGGNDIYASVSVNKIINVAIKILDYIYVDSVNGKDDNGGSSWGEAVQSISKAMAIVSANCGICLADGIYSLDKQIVINKTVTIIGNGSKTVITNNKCGFSVFYVNATDVSIYDCSFVNNSASDYGGAILNQGSVFVSGCSFVNNSAGIDGGAIFNSVWSLGPVFVSGCSFVNNSATYGGAIFNSGSSLTATDCIFGNNPGLGVIYNNGALNLNNNEYSGIEEGKTYIYNGGTLSSVIITVLDNETITVKKGSTISLHAAITCDGASVAGKSLKFIIGGIPYNAESNVNGNYIGSYDVDFINSQEVVGASYDGAGNVVVNTAVLTYKLVCELNVSIGNITHGEDLIISGNITKGVSGNVTITINDTRKYNATISEEGKIYYVIPDLSVGDYKVTVSYGGNDIYASTSVNKIINVAIKVLEHVYVDSVNGKDDNGGSSWDEAVKTIGKAMDLVIANGKIYLADGIHIIKSQITIDKTVTIVGNGTKTLITNNGSGDGVFCVSADDTAIYNCTFVNNTGSYYGAVIYGEWLISGLTVSGCTFINNSAYYGCAIYGEWDTSNFTVTNSTFINNTAEYGGGAICNSGDAFIVSGCTFVNNTVKSAYGFGGAIYNDWGDINIMDSIFDNNNASNGVIYNYATLTLNNNKYSGIAEGKTYIYNDGILSSVIVTVLDNETIAVKKGNTISLYAVITCDGASVTGRDLKFLINGNSYNAENNINGSYIADYNVDLANPEEVVSASYDGADEVIVNTGVLTYKLISELNISIWNITYGKDLIISGNITKGATGNVNITINDTLKYNTTISDDGKIYYVVPDLGAGEYEVTVSYGGDEKYAGDEVTKIINVSQAIANLKVSIANVTYGETSTITVQLTGVNNTKLDGKVVITINGNNYTVDVVNGSGTSDKVKLPVNTYKFEAVGNTTNNNYAITPLQGSFNVSKANLNLNIKVETGKNVTIIVSALANATGNVTIKVDNKTYDVKIENGVATKEIANLSAGNYTIDVTYTGDNNYNSTLASANFTVGKLATNIDFEAKNITYGENLTLTILNLPEDATGTLTIIFGNNELSRDIADKILISNFEAGNHTITVKYSGNNKYVGSSTAHNISVAKAGSKLEVNIKNIDYGEILNITATLYGVNNAQLNGTINMKINGKPYAIEIKDGVCTYDDIILPAGVWEFNATWEGNTNYNSTTFNGKFNISKITPAINVDINDILVGENATVVVRLPDDAAGNVYVIVGNNKYTAPVKSGMANINIPNLSRGNHNIIINYTGDDNYLPNETTDNIVVYEALDYNMTIDTSDNAKVGDIVTITVNLPKNATGNVNVTIEGKTYSAIVKNGIASVNVTGLTAGNHSMIAEYGGDNKYLPEYVIGVIKVSKVDNYELTIDVENTIIKVNVPKDATGRVIINIMDNDYVASITDGVATFNIHNLTSRNYNITAIYDGNDKYAPKNTTKTIDMPKIDVNMNITIPEKVNSGENTTIIVNLANDATGNVNVTIEGKTYSAIVKNGIASVNLTALTAGNHSMIVEYGGDDKYLSKYVISVIKVSKVNCPMNITANDISVGEDAVIKVNVPKDATGRIIINDYVAAITDGVAMFTISGLRSGTYNIVAIYDGNDKYAPNEANTTIKVINKNLIVDDVVMIYHDGSRLYATLLDVGGNPLANATLSFAINGMKYNRTTDINGRASIALNLEVGNYTATVSYENNLVNAAVIIKSSITASDIVKMYQNDTQFSGTFFKTDGNPLANKNVTFNINGVLYTRETNSNGIAKLNINLMPGNYILTAINPITGEQKGFNVLVKSLIEASDLTKYYQNASQFMAKIYNKDGSLAINKEVNFNINGVLYTRTTDSNGIASLGINLMPGNYVITTIVDGLAIGNNICVLPTLETKDLTISYHGESVFKAKTLDSHGNPLANQTVRFNVNGVFYNKVSDENGIASLDINLNKGEYIITSIWNDYQVGNKITIS